ncbi:hypothetical protein Ple7327_3368 [Pleurocapsa sp. PCC 7327]|nr:hypothetical protein Ple7327_3368 [Pleurocapsa sp. PCC 7327]
MRTNRDRKLAQLKLLQRSEWIKRWRSLFEGFMIFIVAALKFIRAQELANRTTETLSGIVARVSIPSS